MAEQRTCGGHHGKLDAEAHELVAGHHGAAHKLREGKLDCDGGSDRGEDDQLRGHPPEAVDLGQGEAGHDDENHRDDE
jgi:hypothetical protein